MPWMLKDGTSLQLTEPCVHMRLGIFNGQVWDIVRNMGTN